MKKTILLTFENPEERDSFLSQLRNVDSNDVDKTLINSILDTAVFDPQINVNQHTTELYVSGKKICDGTRSHIQKLFDQEIISHSANVEMRELKADGTWKIIMSRKHSN